MSIVLYTIGCPKCNILEEKLNKNGIRYSICEDTNLMKEKGYSVLPILEVDDFALTFKDAVSWVNSQGE